MRRSDSRAERDFLTDRFRNRIENCQALSGERERLAAKYPYAVVHAEWYHDVHKLDDFMGPPSEQFQKAAAGHGVEKKAGDSRKGKSAQELFPEGGWD